MNKESSLTRLTLNNIQFYANHGVRSEEQTLGGRYQVDIDLYYSDKTAVLSDDVQNALNYEEIVYSINEIVNGDSYSLIETLSYEIASELMDKFSAIEKLSVRLRKLTVPIRHIIDYVEVERSMSRDGF
jgi:dihydroneopterin aldolase